MSGAPSAGHNQSFQDRLNRVADVRTPAQDTPPAVAILPDWKAAFVGPIGIALAILVGMLAVIGVRVALYHGTGAAMIGENPDTMMAIETGAALVASFLVFLVLPYKGAKFNFLQFFGVVVMISMMHNLVHKAPGLFGLAFSPQWAQTVTAVTEPNSFFVRGNSVPFAKPAKEEKALPVVRRG